MITGKEYVEGTVYDKRISDVKKLCTALYNEFHIMSGVDDAGYIICWARAKSDYGSFINNTSFVFTYTDDMKEDEFFCGISECDEYDSWYAAKMILKTEWIYDNDSAIRYFRNYFMKKTEEKLIRIEEKYRKEKEACNSILENLTMTSR